MNTGDNDGRTPLMLAAANGQSETVKLLMEKGANLDLKDGNGKTAEMIAGEHGNWHIQANIAQSALARRNAAIESLIKHAEAVNDKAEIWGAADSAFPNDLRKSKNPDFEKELLKNGAAYIGFQMLKFPDVPSESLRRAVDYGLVVPNVPVPGAKGYPGDLLVLGVVKAGNDTQRTWALEKLEIGVRDLGIPVTEEMRKTVTSLRDITDIKAILEKVEPATPPPAPALDILKQLVTKQTRLTNQADVTLTHLGKVAKPAPPIEGQHSSEVSNTYSDKAYAILLEISKTHLVRAICHRATVIAGEARPNETQDWLFKRLPQVSKDTSAIVETDPAAAGVISAQQTTEQPAALASSIDSIRPLERLAETVDLKSSNLRRG